ncbi:hypothetical protein ACHAW5_002251 [Stephanodiscus triporus]|uniref:Cyclic nucleotide-binding domain-containing protein n=1 Tax=Stephanodiscus triporus TaxID=2934178 RepID=A0ABD3NJ51_9STRA
MGEPLVTIDDEFQLRVLDPEVHERSTRLVADCELFVLKVQEFQAIVESIHADMNRMAKNTERHRLKAIGKRLIREQRHSSNENALR